MAYTKAIPEHTTKAGALWEGFNDSEKFGVRFGMFPYAALHTAEQEGYDTKVIVHELMHLASKGA